MVEGTQRFEQWQVATVCAAAVSFVGARFAAESYIAGIFGAIAGASSAGCYYLYRERTDLRSRLTGLNESDRKAEREELRETKQNVKQLTTLEAEKDTELARRQTRIRELSDENDGLRKTMSEAGALRKKAFDEASGRLRSKIAKLEHDLSVVRGILIGRAKLSRPAKLSVMYELLDKICEDISTTEDPKAFLKRLRDSTAKMIDPDPKDN